MSLNELNEVLKSRKRNSAVFKTEELLTELSVKFWHGAHAPCTDACMRITVGMHIGHVG